MILIDTHIFIWLAGHDSRLSAQERAWLVERADQGLAVSVLSCWEIAKKVEIGKLELDRPVDAWLHAALREPGIVMVDLTLPIVIESTHLPGSVHKDPVDQMLIATSRVCKWPLFTRDEKIIAYPHVEKARV